MRPLRLELEGFTTFREKTVVDFDGADLFALTGNTGAGKSSLIDAIVFVLYGVVPRYDDLRRVGQVISQRAEEARIRLDFSVGTDSYAAVRVVRRTKSGSGATKEARLEKALSGGDSEVLAGGADELTAAVTELLGLGFEHFTRCVVLPQGEFARFLLDKDSKRRALLERLLDIGIYEDMGQRARDRNTALKRDVEHLDKRLAELGDVDAEAVAAAERQIETAEAMDEALGAAEPRLRDFDAALHGAQEQAAAAANALTALDRIEMPDSVGDLANEIAAARSDRDAARAAEADAVGAREAAERDVERLPPRSDLEVVVRAYADRETLAREIEAAEAGLAPLRDAAAAARSADEAAATAVADAESQFSQVRNAHLAHTLAETLVAGAPCPVCEREVETVPALAAVPEKSAAERLERQARSHQKETAAELARCHDAVSKAAGAHDALRGKFADIEARLSEAPALVATREMIDRLDAAEAGARAAREAHEHARAALDTAQKRCDEAGAADAAARGEFGRARDSVAVLGPPEPGQDLRADWAALVDWARAQRPVHAAAAAAADEAAATARAGHDELIAALMARARETGIEATSFDELRRGVHYATAQAKSVHEALVARAEEAASKREERERVDGERATADALGVHLKSNNFRDWLLREAFEALVKGATDLLRELSDGAYSLKLGDKGRFDVIDHRNADEARSARTLSGGETFLASLALALALGDHIFTMNTEGTARLESLFLDEGFGTLDADTLDTVTDAIFGLGAKGRMVGLVTHVRDLAERMPVRFEVTKGPGGSSVERVDT